MQREELAMLIAGICIILGTFMLLFGIATSEIEITKKEREVTYDNVNN